MSGDGSPDFVVGAPGATGSDFREGGAVYLSTAAGEPAGRLNGSAPGDRFGQTVRLAGDLNHDGLSELVVGAPGLRLDEGAVGGSVFFQSAMPGDDRPR